MLELSKPISYPALLLSQFLSLYLALSKLRENALMRLNLNFGRCRMTRFISAALMLALLLVGSTGSSWATALEDGTSDFAGPAMKLAAPIGPPVPSIGMSAVVEPVQISELPTASFVAGTNNEQFRQKMGQVVGYIQGYNKRLAWGDISNIAQAIVQYSERYSIDYRLLTSLIAIESGFRRDVVSSSGAIGMGQLKPATAHWLGVVDPYNPVDNIAGTARFLSWLVHRYNGNLEFALSAYYQGPGFVDKNGIAPVCVPYLEKVNRALGPMM